MSQFIGYIWFAFWVAGGTLLMLSNASLAIRKTKFKRKPSRTYLMGYSIKEIREAIDLTTDEKIKKRLTRKIAYRRIGISLMVATPVLFIIQGIVKVSEN